jgi:poly(hydroxyalkanoate) granule-associated protein
MLKKAKVKVQSAAASAESSKDMSQSVLDSSRQIWLAGLGAFSRAQAEGRKMFDGLVKQGETLEAHTRTAASTTAAAARGAAAEGAARVQTMAGDTWARLEKVFEERVAKTQARRGVSAQSEVERLSERVDALAETVNALIRTSGGMPKPQRKTSPAKRAAKRAVKSAVRATTRPAGDATQTVSKAVGGAGKTARKVARVSRKVTKTASGASD